MTWHCMSMTHDIVHFILPKLCIVHDMHWKLTCTDTSLQDPDLVRIIIEYGGRIQLYCTVLHVYTACIGRIGYRYSLIDSSWLTQLWQPVNTNIDSILISLLRYILLLVHVCYSRIHVHVRTVPARAPMHMTLGYPYCREPKDLRLQ